MSDERPVVRRAGDGAPVVPAPISPADTAPRLSDSGARSGVPRYKFQIPKSARLHGDRDPTDITLRELTDDEMLQAEKLSRGSSQKFVGEAVKLALDEVNGHPVDHSKAEAEFFWARWSSKVRFLAILGWKKIHNTEDGEDRDFLQSMSSL